MGKFYRLSPCFQGLNSTLFERGQPRHAKNKSVPFNRSALIQGAFTMLAVNHGRKVAGRCSIQL